MHDRVFWRSWADTQHARRRSVRRRLVRWVMALIAAGGVLCAFSVYVRW